MTYFYEITFSPLFTTKKMPFTWYWPFCPHSLEINFWWINSIIFWWPVRSERRCDWSPLVWHERRCERRCDWSPLVWHASDHLEKCPRPRCPGQRTCAVQASTARRPVYASIYVKGLLLLVPPPRSCVYVAHAHTFYVVMCYMSITCVFSYVIWVFVMSVICCYMLYVS